VFGAFGPQWREYNNRQDQRLWKGGIVKAKEYEVLRRAVEEGCAYGIRRYYKHRGSCPTPLAQEEIGAEIADSVVNAICEWFEFDDAPAEKLDSENRPA